MRWMLNIVERISTTEQDSYLKQRGGSIVSPYTFDYRRLSLNCMGRMYPIHPEPSSMILSQSKRNTTVEYIDYYFISKYEKNTILQRKIGPLVKIRV